MTGSHGKKSTLITRTVVLYSRYGCIHSSSLLSIALRCLPSLAIVINCHHICFHCPHAFVHRRARGFQRSPLSLLSRPAPLQRRPAPFHRLLVCFRGQPAVVKSMMAHPRTHSVASHVPSHQLVREGCYVARPGVNPPYCLLVHRSSCVIRFGCSVRFSMEFALMDDWICGIYNVTEGQCRQGFRAARPPVSSWCPPCPPGHTVLLPRVLANSS
jgi:hypothetical protein